MGGALQTAAGSGRGPLLIPFRRPQSTFAFLLAVLLAFNTLQISNSFEERLCGSLDIRNHPHMFFSQQNSIHLEAKYANCTVLEGIFSLSMMTNNTVNEEDFPSFPSIVEITGYVLIFNVRSLTTLSRIFPNLRVIGGQQLIMNYALIIYQNPHLKEIGLPSLRVIRNGGVRITENPSLCYTRNIAWNQFLYGPINDVLVSDGSTSGQQCNDHCDVPDTVRCHSVQSGMSCWNATHCQEVCDYDMMPSMQSTDGREPGPGCALSAPEESCHDQCMAGCEHPDDATSCFSCRAFRHQGACVPACPSHLFSYLGRCITRDYCLSLKDHRPNSDGLKKFYKPVNGKCDFDCPIGYEEYSEDPNSDEIRECRKCEGDCPRRCGSKQVDTESVAYELEGCDIVEGNVEIELRLSNDFRVEKLATAFGSIKTITGYLLIRFSPSLVSLSMFKNLTSVLGRELYQNRYAIAIYENHNLRYLFPQKNMTIGNGTVQVHNNRMLCYERIVNFMGEIGMRGNMSEEDQSTFSNGDKAICEESTFNITSVWPLPAGFAVSWQAFNTSDIDHRKFLGYQVYYKRVNTNNVAEVAIDEDRSACTDSWMMQFEPVKNDLAQVAASPDGGNNTENVKAPATVVETMIAHEGVAADANYAVYVQTRMVNHPGARNAISRVVIVRTLFNAPTAPRIKKVEAKEPGKISIEWDPPDLPNGNVTHYRVTWQPQYRAMTYEIKHACETGGSVFRAGSSSPRDSDGFSPNGASPAPSMASFLKGEGTCSQQPGCCECSTKPADPDDPRLLSGEHKDVFENAVQNIVFVQSDEDVHNGKRRARSLGTPNPDKDEIELLPPLDDDEEDVTAEGTAANSESEEMAKFSMPHPTGYLMLVPDPPSESSTINVTGFSLVLEGLRHFTEYQISMAACQDQNVESNYCSKPVFHTIRTVDIKEKDIVNADSIVTHTINGSNYAMVTFDPPEDPNNKILGFRVTMYDEEKEATPITDCANLMEFGGGIIFKGMADGSYRVEVSAITLARTSPPAVAKQRVHINVPGFFTLTRLLIIALSLLIVLGVAAFIIWHCVNRYYGKRVGEYIRQTISANPEYLSQFEIYKQDDWELPRTKITLNEEIGRGTFGKVFRGFGHDLDSKCGVQFGVCAVKTVSDDANPSERLHFLIEASVMKQFNTSFIVKLFGVVSDGQPVLVVMEMMAKGNLRDYLRSRRPEAEENTEGLPVPTDSEYGEWAAQIADGMAYLESLKFCHRDLAARNCMVASNEMVKIGDFGMARDIYYHEYYKPTGKRLMPVRWMAPESLKDGKFSLKSDVWSYGIVLYEMLTLAQQPYQGLQNDKVFEYIGVSRQILQKPTDCPDFWYDLMVACWKYQPKDRPTFRQIVEALESRTSDRFHQLSWVLNDGGDGGSYSEQAVVTDAISQREDPDYVPEPTAYRADDVIDEEEGSAICIQNRKPMANGHWRGGEGDGFARDAEAEL